MGKVRKGKWEKLFMSFRRSKMTDTYLIFFCSLILPYFTFLTQRKHYERKTNEDENTTKSEKN